MRGARSVYTLCACVHIFPFSVCVPSVCVDSANYTAWLLRLLTDCTGPAHVDLSWRAAATSVLSFLWLSTAVARCPRPSVSDSNVSSGDHFDYFQTSH